MAVRIYTAMVRLQTLDTVFYDAQRQVTRFDPCDASEADAVSVRRTARGRALLYRVMVSRHYCQLIHDYAGPLLVLHDQQRGGGDSHRERRSADA